MKKGLLIVVVLLAMASMMAAMAVSSASVNSDFGLAIANSDDALVALSPSDYHDAAYMTSGALADVLKIDLTEGYDGNNFGLQPNSTYIWDELYNIKNNTEHTVDVTVKLENLVNGTSRSWSNKDNGPAHFAVFAKIGDTWTKLADTYGGNELTFQLAPNTSEWVDFKVEVEKGYVEPYDFNMVVEADDTYR